MDVLIKYLNIINRAFLLANGFDTVIKAFDTADPVNVKKSHLF